MTFFLFKYGVTIRRPVHFLGRLDTYYPGYTIVFEWPLELWRRYPDTTKAEVILPPDYDDIPF